MLFVKYTFLFFIFLGASLIGNLFSKKFSKRVKELKKFKEAYNIIESKIKFTYEPLGEIFNQISNILKNQSKIGEIFKITSEKMKQYDFKTSWENSLEENKNNLNLKDEDISILKNLGNMLGKTDVEGQLNEIKLNMSFLDTQIIDAEEECKKNEKMYRTLGTIFGLAIIIILI